MSSALVRLTLVVALAGIALPVRARQDDAERLIALARQALGGEARLSGIKSFKASGVIAETGWAASHTTYGTFEISCVLPDKFVEIEDRGRFSASGSVATASGGGSGSSSWITAKLGFNGDRVIADGEGVYRLGGYEYGPGSWTSAFPNPRQQELAVFLGRARAQSVNVTLGLFAASLPGVPVSFSAATGTGAGQSVDVTGPQFQRTTLRFNPTTHLPSGLGYLSYEDFRDVGGLQVPFRMTLDHEVHVIKEFRYNVDVDPKLFRPSGR